MLDGGARLYGLYLQGGTDVGQRRRAERKRFRVVLLPSLVLGPEVEGAGVLEIGGQYNGLVAGLAGQLNTQVPGVESDENEVQVLRVELLGRKGVETVHSIPEVAGISDVFPGQGGQARCQGGGTISPRAKASGSNDMARLEGSRRRQVDGQEAVGNKMVLTAERGDGRVDRLDEDALVVQLSGRGAKSASVQLWVGHGPHAGAEAVSRMGTGLPTSSKVFASTKIQPISITSAESFVT